MDDAFPNQLAVLDFPSACEIGHVVAPFVDKDPQHEETTGQGVPAVTGSLTHAFCRVAHACVLGSHTHAFCFICGIWLSRSVHSGEVAHACVLTYIISSKEVGKQLRTNRIVMKGGVKLYTT